jgi:Spy/CpxP family protein refolding chaperone
MTRLMTALLIALLATVATAYAQTETASHDAAAVSEAAETPKKYGPLYQQELKDQAASAMFRDLKIVKRFARRLPNFYSQVVSNAQRDKVYEIQAAYFEPMEMLTLRLERLVAERDAQMEAVLTAEQKAKVEALAKESAARRTATRGAANANAD